MLHEFLAANDNELAQRCHAKVVARMAPKVVSEEFHGVAELIRQLIETLRGEHGTGTDVVPLQIGEAAERHGLALLRAGYTVGELVHDYGDLCQALTELAHERRAAISVEEFRTFNRCLDDAIADAVTEFGRGHDLAAAEVGEANFNARLGSLAHELRNHLSTATLAFGAVQTGTVALNGSTAGLVMVGLNGACDLIDRALAEVRATALPMFNETVPVEEIIDQVALAANMAAVARNVSLSTAVDPGLVVHGDRRVLGAAVFNVLQNAVKFTHPQGHISLRAYHTEDRVIIEVSDECGGLPPGLPERLFEPFVQANRDRTGIGLGLSISRRGVEANGGTLSVRDVPRIGCVFTIDLPRPSLATATPSVVSRSKRLAYVARDSILGLLTDDELARVSNVQAVPDDDEYVDLEHLDRGIHKAPLPNHAVSRVVPRSAVSSETWQKIVAVLGVMP